MGSRSRARWRGFRPGPSSPCRYRNGRQLIAKLPLSPGRATQPGANGISGPARRGGIETLGLIADQFQLHGAFWNAISNLNDNFGTLGYGIVAFFVLSSGLSFLIYRFKRYDLNPGLDRF